jgi:hypothetical protein
LRRDAIEFGAYRARAEWRELTSTRRIEEHIPMRNSLFAVCLAATCLLLTAPAAVAQAMIHAVSGIVVSNSSKGRMLEIATDDGSSGHFEWAKKSDGAIDFDKNVSADSTAVDKFETQGTHVIVYYFGDGDERRAVAVHDLGAAPVNAIRGSVIKFNRNGRELTIKDGSGAELTYHLDLKTVGDTEIGVRTAMHYDFSKGQPVRVTTEKSDANATALLIAPVI